MINHSQKQDESQPQQTLKYLSFFKEEKPHEVILQVLLRNYNEEEQDVRNKVARVKNILVDQLDNFDRTEENHFRKYLKCDHLQKYLQYFCGNRVEGSQIQEGGQLTLMKQTYIGYLQKKIDELIGRVKMFRNEMKSNMRRKEKEAKVNRLLFLSYNIKNYIEQLQLVKNLKQRVQKIVESQVPDIRHVQELSHKKTVPYTFYRTFCLNNCCRVIDKRVKAGKLVMLKRSQSNIQLLEHFKGYFFRGRGLSEKCSILLTFCKQLRIMSQQGVCMEDGFLLSFRQYFMELLKQSVGIGGVEFMKARSMMQSDGELIDIWKQFEQIKLQSYSLWYSRKMEVLRKSETVHLQLVKQTLNIYKQQFSWIDELKVRSTKLTQKYAFNQYYMKTVICKVLHPFLAHLFFNKIDNLKTLQKYRREYKQYWIYWLFHKYRRLFLLLKDQFMGVVNHLEIKEKKENVLQGSQLNLQQYYGYYRQISNILDGYLDYKGSGQEFQGFWKEIIVKVSESQLLSNHKIERTSHIQYQFDSSLFYQHEQSRLKLLLDQPQLLPPQKRKEEIYRFVMKLHFNIGNYFLLRRAAKELGREVEEEIRVIRQVAYNQFYS